MKLNNTIYLFFSKTITIIKCCYYKIKCNIIVNLFCSFFYPPSTLDAVSTTFSIQYLSFVMDALNAGAYHCCFKLIKADSTAAKLRTPNVHL